ncbi:single-stranded-DNA-specific exonuclease RecJ [Pannus brasiliensis]
MPYRYPLQRWRIAEVEADRVDRLAQETGFPPLLATVLINRGITTPELAKLHIDPESHPLPSPLEEFPDLAKSVDLLVETIRSGDSIAICGDYDADGMTSTALLLRALRHLDAEVYHAIPSRMKEGYGINNRIVKEFAESGIGLILTVDNGISALEPIALAVELGLSVIVTDHHDIPETLPPADAILNPKLLPESSPYHGLAGVGVAYILAVSTARELGKLQGLTESLLELFTLGTIADLAPLVGVNRRWLKRGLRRLPRSRLAGVQALIQMSGVSDAQKQLKPDDIGFKLGPRINAIGRIGDPGTVIELLTTDDAGTAVEMAMRCEEVNRTRQELCERIEREAIELVETTPINWRDARVLVVVRDDWHHGVIGIVASRLVERYGVPVFIGTYEEGDPGKIRGSARGIEEFHVFEALEFCRDLLGKFGGHKMAGGFSLETRNLDRFQQQLSQFAHRLLEPEHLKPLIEIDAEMDFSEITVELFQQIESLQPWGIGNQFPVFWTPNVRVVEQQKVGKNHVKLILATDDDTRVKAIAWRWAEYLPLPNRIDIAYKLQENSWQGDRSIEIELIGMRLPAEKNGGKKARFVHEGRFYACSFLESLNEIRIKNERGEVLAVQKGQKIGLLGYSRDNARSVDVTQPNFYSLIKAAVKALAL